MKSASVMKLCALLSVVLLAPPEKVEAQIPIIGVITTGVKKVIMAIDLQVQRMQNKTIWLQNAQKEMENILSETKLTEISDWVEKQKDLYGDYFDELWKVKEVIEYYHRIEEMVDKQIKIVDAYETAFNLFKQDSHFTADELDYMEKVYSGIIEQSLKNLDQLFLVINSFTTQMSDEKRLEIINEAGTSIDENYTDLKLFNNQNAILSLQRSKDMNEAAVVKQLYNLK